MRNNFQALVPIILNTKPKMPSPQVLQIRQIRQTLWNNLFNSPTSESAITWPTQGSSFDGKSLTTPHLEVTLTDK